MLFQVALVSLSPRLDGAPKAHPWEAALPPALSPPGAAKDQLTKALPRAWHWGAVVELASYLL